MKRFAALLVATGSVMIVSQVASAQTYPPAESSTTAAYPPAEVTTTTEAAAVTTTTEAAATTTTTLPAPSASTISALPAATTPLVSNSNIQTGTAVTVTYSGFTAGETVQLIVASTPQVIGTAVADASGSATVSGNIPADLAAGTHTLAIYAPVSGVGFTQSITVTATALPATGGEMATRLGIIFVAAGIGMFAISQRRRRNIADA